MASTRQSYSGEHSAHVRGQPCEHCGEPGFEHERVTDASGQRLSYDFICPTEGEGDE